MIEKNTVENKTKLNIINGIIMAVMSLYLPTSMIFHVYNIIKVMLTDDHRIYEILYIVGIKVTTRVLH